MLKGRSKKESNTLLNTSSITRKHICYEGFNLHAPGLQKISLGLNGPGDILDCKKKRGELIYVFINLNLYNY